MTKIVVGVDDSAYSDLAIRWAVHDAQLRGADVELVHGYVLYFRRTETTASRELAQPVMDRIIARNREVLDTVKWNSTVVPVMGASYSAALVRAADDADLLVVGSRGRGGFGGLLLGSTSYRTAGHARCPVVVVHGEPGVTSPAAVERVVVGIDGSRQARRALRWALDEAELREVPVTVVHAYADRAFLPRAGLQSDAQLEHVRSLAHQQAVELSDAALQAVDAPSGGRVHQVVAVGSAAGMLLDHAGADALLVVGSRGHGVGQVLVGSVTHQCLHHAVGPVVVVP